MTRRRWWHYPLGLAAWPLTWPWILVKAMLLAGGTAALWVWWRR